MKRSAIIFLLSVLALTACTQKHANTNGIWLWSKYMEDVDLDELVQKNIGNIILHEVAFEKYGENRTMEFVKAAEQKGLLVHIWFQCFYTDGKWINPVDDENDRYRQEYFDEVIERAEHYVEIGVKAIHLDYIRFGGTAWKHNPSDSITATGCVTEFCRQMNVAVKKLNPEVVLSAALMPEPESEYYYGQNPAQMGQYVDILMPMIYRHAPAYSKGGEGWAAEVAKYFVENGAPAQVWAGTTTYTGDDDSVIPMESNGIIKDCRDFSDTGIKGIILFRYGLGELPDMSEINYGTR